MSESNSIDLAQPVTQPDEQVRLIGILAALGVVFGDIGTSPLYALRECFSGPSGLALQTENVLGVVSVMLWTLTLTVSIKYILIVMRADNRGEGGILALITLASSVLSSSQKKNAGFFVILGILGAALLYSDGIITPAITVLGAVEGLSEGAAAFHPFIIPITIVILAALFLIQSHGTAKVGRLFGPVLFVWFLTIGLIGIFAIIRNPQILHAINPWHAVMFVVRDGGHSFAVLGSVFLCVTGAEMMFADMGHFGKKPIRRAWFSLVYPCLVLNYLGQGGFLLTGPSAVDNLFYSIVPQWFLYPMVAISTSAAIIASQAVISGAYSLTRQAVQLGFWPRMQVRHTSSSTIGQVYVPFVNWSLMVGVILLILFFKKSGNLASAYGIAVSIDMFLTTILIIFIARKKWLIPLPLLIIGAMIFIVIDGSFLASNLLKISSGGWIVLLIAGVIILFMKTWIDGREILRKSLMAGSLDLPTFTKDIKQNAPQRVPGIAVFLSGNPHGVPRALLHNLKHNKVLHKYTIILSIQNDEIPYVMPQNRAQIDDFGAGIIRIKASYGFSETPDIQKLLQSVKIHGVVFDPMQTTFFLGREVLVVLHNRMMYTWRKRIFSFMSHNSLNATSFFRLPVNRVIELGAQIEL